MSASERGPVQTLSISRISGCNAPVTSSARPTTSSAMTVINALLPNIARKAPDPSVPALPW